MWHLDGVGLDAEHAPRVRRKCNGEDRRPCHRRMHRPSTRPPPPTRPVPAKSQQHEGEQSWSDTGGRRRGQIVLFYSDLPPLIQPNQLTNRQRNIFGDLEVDYATTGLHSYYFFILIIN